MTLENVKRLLEHYEKTGQNDRAEEMRVRIARKLNHPKYANSKPVESKPKVKK